MYKANATIEKGVYGRRLGDCFGLPKEPEYIRIEKSSVAITQIRCDRENNGMTAPIPVEDALLFTLQLRDCIHHDLWIDGRQRRTGPLKRGDVCVYDLRTSPSVNSTSPFYSIHLYVPRPTLNSIANQEGLRAFDECAHEPGLGLGDPVVAGLGLSLESAFKSPGDTTRIFVDHVTSAIVAHLIKVLGKDAPRRELGVISLSTRQERLAKELLAAHIDGEIATSDVAEACGLSAPAFRKGFEKATGKTPHQWLMHFRIESAIDLLANQHLSPGEAARLSGFADARHLRRVLMINRRLTIEQILQS